MACPPWKRSGAECPSADAQSSGAEGWVLEEESNLHRFAKKAKNEMTAPTRDDEHVVEVTNKMMNVAIGNMKVECREQLPFVGDNADVDTKTWRGNDDTQRCEWQSDLPPGSFNAKNTCDSVKKDIYGRKGLWKDMNSAELDNDKRIVELMEPLSMCAHQTLPTKNLVCAMKYVCSHCKQVAPMM